MHVFDFTFIYYIMCFSLFFIHIDSSLFSIKQIDSSIYYKSNTDEKNNMNDINNEENENEKMNDKNMNIDEITKNESDDNKNFEIVIEY